MPEHIVEKKISKFNPLAYLKALGSGIATSAFLLASYVQGDETLANVTTNEWLWVLIGFLASIGVTYVIPNRKNKVS